MVRSSGHHRKRSLSRSVSPSDHKRVKSSYRDREKDRSRRRSRSRDRLRRSRSRDRKSKDKRPSESRLRSKPLKLKRRSRSRSREHVVKKEEKKEVKADDEPFDPTNLDKQKNVEETEASEDWTVIDMVQENSLEEDNGDENENLHESRGSLPVYSEVLNNNHKGNSVDKISKTSRHRTNSRSVSDSSESHYSNYKDNDHRRGNMKSRSTNTLIYDEKSTTPKIDLELNQAKELHQLRMKNEIEKHKAEMVLISLQTQYWQYKYGAKHDLESTFMPDTCRAVNRVSNVGEDTLASSTGQVAGSVRETKQVHNVGTNQLSEKVSEPKELIITSMELTDETDTVVATIGSPSFEDIGTSEVTDSPINHKAACELAEITDDSLITNAVGVNEIDATRYR